MHIPDGYLSPSTCAVMYVGAAAGWYAALKRLKRVLITRMVPLISVFAAFAFVVMMFNIPLPGGTTGHALGVTAAAIVLGPSGAVLAISIAIAIQALFFGDGGILTLGANCLNMAIVGSVVAYAGYRAVAGTAAPTSRRRVIAAGVAGYLAANASGLASAVELGIQPLLFHNAQGAPLYAPYPLRIAIPAIMIGHLTFAGLAEAVLSAGIVAYLQASDPGLLEVALGSVSAEGEKTAGGGQRWNLLRRLWLVVAMLTLLAPLGILAAGTAWGEWSRTELTQHASHPAIGGGSSMSASAGLQKLTELWTAPFPGYAPKFVKSPSFGYVLSAMFGVGLLLGGSLVLQSWLDRRRSTRPLG